MKIKKKLKFIVPSALIISGIILCIIALASGAISDYKKNLDLNELEANIPVSNISNLNIDVPIADVSIFCSNDVDSFYISASNITKSFLEYSASNNTLNITYDTKKWYQSVMLPGYWNCEGSIELYIPAETKLKDVQITAEYGNMQIRYLKADRAFINCGKNNNNINDLTCNYTEINNKSGDINAVNINSENIDLNMTSGNSSFSNFVSNSVIIKNESSDLNLSGIIKGDSAVQSEGGDVKLTLYGEKSDYDFDVAGGSPTVNDKDPYENKDGKYLFKLQGDIDIKIK